MKIYREVGSLYIVNRKDAEGYERPVYEIEVDEAEPRGTYQCFHCGAYSVVWQSDFSFEDYGMEGEGVINVCHCTNCGADIEYFVRMDEEEDTYIPYNNGSL